MIRIIQSISGRTDGHDLALGSEHELNPVIEAQLVAQEYAEYISKPAPVAETTEVAPPENAAVRTSKPKPRTSKR